MLVQEKLETGKIEATKFDIQKQKNITITGSYEMSMSMKKLPINKNRENNKEVNIIVAMEQNVDL